MNKTIRVLLVALAIAALGGCAAAQVAMTHKDLKVSSKMSASVFLDPVAMQDHTVFLQLRNTSDHADMDITDALTAAIANRGYQVVQDPEQAHYWLQVNILQVGEMSPSAAEQMLGAGYAGMGAGALATGAAGAYTAGAFNASGGGMARAGLIAGAAEFVSGALVKNVTFNAITDVQISEQVNGQVQSQSNQELTQGTSGSTTQTYQENTDRRKYQTRILTTANQVNLKWEEAEQPMAEGLVKTISGLL